MEPSPKTRPLPHILPPPTSGLLSCACLQSGGKGRSELATPETRTSCPPQWAGVWTQRSAWQSPRPSGGPRLGRRPAPEVRRVPGAALQAA